MKPCNSSSELGTPDTEGQVLSDTHSTDEDTETQIREMVSYGFQEVNDRPALESRAPSSSSSNDRWVERRTDGQTAGCDREKNTEMTSWHLAIKI